MLSLASSCCAILRSSRVSPPRVPCVRLLSYLALVYKTTQGADFLPPSTLCVLLIGSGPTFVSPPRDQCYGGIESGVVSALHERTYKRTMARRLAGTEPR